MKNQFVAIDGKVFDNEDDCLFYEGELREGYQEKFRQNHFIIDCPQCAVFDNANAPHLYHIEDERDLKFINEYIALYTECDNDFTPLPKSCIGKTIMIVFDYDGDYIIEYGTEAMLNKNVKEILRSVFQQVEVFFNNK